MEFVYSSAYRADIGSHVFPTEKYPLIYKTLEEEGIITRENTLAPERPTDEELLKIITREYLEDLLNVRTTHRTFPSEMPVNRAIIEAQILCCGGSYLAANQARSQRACYHIGGGFHHAFPDHAEGFCYLNDVVFGVVMMLGQGVEKIAVVDLDLHQGNGTAKFFENDDRVFTFSMHQERLYPKKERSNLDIGLDGGIRDQEYLQKLDDALEIIFRDFRPDLVMYLAGADPYIFDQLGNLALSLEGLRKRDETVIRQCFSNGTPVAVVLGGGYGEDIHDTVEIHCNTARVLDQAVHDERGQSVRAKT